MQFLRRLAWLTAIILLLLIKPSFANSVSQQLQYSTVEIQTSHDAVTSQQKIWLAVHFQLKPNWHVYWKNPGDSGLPPTFKVTANHPILVEDTLYPPPQRIPVNHLINYGYYDGATYYVPIVLQSSAKTGRLALKIDASWLVCLEECIPEKATFNITLPIQDSALRAKQYSSINKSVSEILNLSALPASAEIDNQQLVLQFENEPWSTQSILEAYFFAEKEDYLALTQRQAYQQDGKQLIFRINQGLDKEISQIAGILEVRSDTGVSHYQVSAPVQKNVEAPADNGRIITWPIAFLFAFLGGILLNIMPCVFPVLSLKVLALCKHNNLEPVQRLAHALYYTLGIILCFMVIATFMLLLQTASVNVGWGFQMQSPNFLLAMIYLIFLVSCFLLGYINFWLPLPNLSTKNAVHPYLESFFTGLLITLVATPCTAPLMAPALGFAFTQPPTILLTTILMLGIGLAMPFILLATIPGATRLIPKGGPWLNTFKEFLAFPMLLTAIWLCWLLLNHVTKIQFILVLGSILCLWMALWVGNLQTKKGIQRCIQLLFLLPMAFCFYQIQSQTPDHTAGVHPQSFSMQKLDDLRMNHQAVFVNVTADWCITCKVNENLVLSTDDFMQHLQKNKITYLKADWTHQDEVISEYLASFNRFGVPTYVYYPSRGEPIVLPQILTKEILFQHLSQ